MSRRRSRQPGGIWTLSRSRSPLIDDSLGDAHVLVGSAIIEEPAPAFTDEALHEDDVRHLTGPLPIPLRLEDRLVGAGKHACRVGAVEERPAGTVDEAVAGAVIYEKDTL